VAEGNEDQIATISDVAAAAGVSKTTVSHVLSGRRPVSEATRAKVHSVIEELGFKQNFFAAGLSGSSSKTIALVVQDLTNPFYPALARGLQQVVGERDYVVLLADVGAGTPPIEVFLAQTVQRRVDGVVVAAVDVRDTQLKPLQRAGIAVVTVGSPRHGTKTDQVSADDHQIARDAVTHLCEQGHELIATITGPALVAPGSSRLAGYRDGLKQNKRSASRARVVEGDWTVASGAKAMAKLMRLPLRPTAVFCANDLMAVGAIETAVALGLAVPEDVAVIGVDDIDAAGLIRPALSTVRIPAQEIGLVAGELVLARIDGADGPQRQVLVPHNLVIRESA
jgi:LacI family transcriptional regulator